VKEKLSPIGYLVESEVTGEVARVHVNGTRKFAEEFSELGPPQDGVFPDSRRMALRVTDSAGERGSRRFKVASPGRTGFVWRAENELPEMVVKAFDLSREDKARLSATKGTDGG
jgi:hypothetical protein